MLSLLVRAHDRGREKHVVISITSPRVFQYYHYPNRNIFSVLILHYLCSLKSLRGPPNVRFKSGALKVSPDYHQKEHSAQFSDLRRK